ncbi:MAG TPA: ABC transporter permease [Pyrinomonadaceae bacterium]
MSWWSRFWRAGRMEEQLDKELLFHLDQHTEDLIARGLAPAEARRQARLAIGGPEQVKEMCRDARGTRWLDDLLRDLRYGVRVLAKQPGFTAVAALALALGIGVNTAILSGVRGLVLRPLPAERPEELVVPYWGRKADAEVWGKFSYPNYVDIRERVTSFSDLCAWSETSAGISDTESRAGGDGERAEIVWGELVSANYFDVMGVKPLLGRSFLPEEGRAEKGHPVVVLGHTLWQRRYNADRAILGKAIYLNGQPYSVVGVMPESFLGGAFYLHKGFWVPLAMSQKFGRRAGWGTDRGYAVLNLYGRLRPGVTMAQAEAELNLAADHLATLHPLENADTKIQLRTEPDGRYEGTTKGIRYAVFLALCVSALVLLLACANVANLMLARAVTRAKEIGIRLALGASRGRVVRQLLTESLLLALLGGAAGCALAYAGGPAILASFPPVPYPISLDFAPDGYVLRWMLLISLLTGVLFGLAPALLTSRSDLVAVIKGAALRSSRGRGRRDLRGALVVAQVTISVVVLICAGLFIRSLDQVRRVDPGFQTENLVTMMINPRPLGYDDKEIAGRLFPELLRRVGWHPGVRSAALIDEMPLAVAHNTRGPIVREGEADPPPNQGTSADCNFVSPGYFETAGTPLVAGRDFTDRDDDAGPRVVIVNQEFARRFYGGEQGALGKRFRFAQGTSLMEIVGVARDGRYRSLYKEPEPHMFLPVYQHPRGGMTVLIGARSAGDVQAVVEGARREIARVDSRLPVFGVMVGEENLALAYWGARLAAGVALTFGVLALVLATMGLYSVMTYAVSQRTHEIGVRMALGARLRDVVRLVVGQGMRMALAGVALGLAAAFALTRVLASLLLGVGTTDAVTFVGVPVLLVAVALLACYVPARRAARVDPLDALRHE